MTQPFDRRKFLRATAMLGMGAGAASMLEVAEAQAQESGATMKCAMSSAGLGGSWNVQGKAAAEAMGKLLGVEVVWFDGEWSIQRQREKIDQVASSADWDFCAFQPGSIGVLRDPVHRLAANGIPVINMDNLIAPLDELYDVGVMSFVTTDNVGMGEAVAEVIVQKMGSAGKIARTGGVSGHTGAKGRHQGFLNVVARYPDVEIVDDQPADWSGERSAQLWEAIINRHPDIKGGFFDNDDMAVAARRVIVGAGLGDQVHIGGIDMMPNAIEAVRSGDMAVTARSSPVRIHGWAVLAGWYAATVGIEQAKKDLPKFVLCDGPVLTADVDSDPARADEPWLLRQWGLSPIEGMLWQQEQFLM